MNDWLYDHGQQHLKDLQREAEQERQANQLPHKRGLLQTALSRLLTRSQAQSHEQQ